jgi:hypothetical protein
MGIGVKESILCTGYGSEWRDTTKSEYDSAKIKGKDVLRFHFD